ncbi:MAG: MscL family protein [Methylocystis sp.]|uniref:MscL family protein n=1 Tax=Methylocystis sp. TaxID=1911079 RepID=UPI003DA6AFD5
MRNIKDDKARSGVLDLALVIVAALAIVKLVDSLVVDILTPLISHFAGDARTMANAFIPVGPGVHSDMTSDEARQIGAVIGYGQFVVALADVIIAATLFLLMSRGLRAWRRQDGAEPVSPTE